MSEILQEKWMKGVAITTTVLAVLTAIASSRAAYNVARAQLLTALEGSQWAYYQAKSIKQNLLEVEKKTFSVEILGALTAAQKELLSQSLAQVQEDIARYEEEKQEIRAKAEKTAAENKLVLKQGNKFSLSVVFFQIGIMLSSVSALLKRKELWFIGLVSGAVAIVLMMSGFLIFIKSVIP